MYIFRHFVRPASGGRKARYVLAPDFHVYETEATRSTGRTIAGFNEVEGTGKMRKDIISIRSDGESVSGHGTKREWRQTIRRTAADVKDNLRRVRPEELEAIQRFDVRIADLEEQLKQVRQARADTVADAWSRAHVVRLQDVEAKLNK